MMNRSHNENTQFNAKADAGRIPYTAPPSEPGTISCPILKMAWADRY